MAEHTRVMLSTEAVFDNGAGLLPKWRFWLGKRIEVDTMLIREVHRLHDTQRMIKNA